MTILVKPTEGWYKKYRKFENTLTAWHFPINNCLLHNTHISIEIAILNPADQVLITKIAKSCFSDHYLSPI
jgi:hypothetical protein